MIRMTVYSFDVFDTCLIRIYADPRDLLLELGSKYLGLKQCIPSLTAAHIADARLQAEKMARTAPDNNREDVTLEAIYSTLEEQFPGQLDTRLLMQLELDLERKSLYPVKSTLQRVQQLSNANERIIYISDTYLSADFIQEVLATHGFHGSSNLYVSGETGLLKRTGNLFRYVLECEGIKARQLHHFGDNKRTDYLVPGLLGVHCDHLHNTRLNRYEKYTPDREADTLTISRINGISRLQRVDTINRDAMSNGISRLAGDVIGPLLTAYMAWVVRDALKRDVRRLYFVARDGQVLFRIATAMSGFMDVPECRYLYGSRHAWFLPSITTESAENPGWLNIRGMSTAPVDILSRLDLSVDDVSHLLQEPPWIDYDLHAQLESADLDAFCRIFIHPDVQALIQKKSCRTRQAALDYFRQEGLLDDVRWSLVDIGWLLNCQVALKRILGNVDPGRHVHGYYLGVNRHYSRECSSDEFTPFIMYSTDKHDNNNWVFKRHAIVTIEDVFTMADHPHVTGYREEDGRMVPEFNKVMNSPDHQQMVNELHMAITCYAKRIAAETFIHDDPDVFIDFALTNAGMYFTEPEREDILPIRHIYTSFEQCHDIHHQRKLVEKLNVVDLLRVIRYELSGKNIMYNNPSHIWLAGSVVLSDNLVRLIFYIMKYINRYLVRPVKSVLQSV